MDIKKHIQEASCELARELLIAISRSLPERVPNRIATENNLDGVNGTVAGNLDSDDELRSALISISYIQSSDIST
ncbi:hypothetical protein NMG60_11027512 [Bertholletia excelsa]